MSIYFIKGKGWRYDFTKGGTRHTKAWFKTKRDAKRAEAKRREEIAKPRALPETPTDMDFLELVNRRLDHIKAYNSTLHYQDSFYFARRWIQRWGGLTCSQVSQAVVQSFLDERREVSEETANKEIRLLRAMFNFGKDKNRQWIKDNPLDGIPFYPVEKRVRHVPSQADIDKVLAEADLDQSDYVWTIRETMGRANEINRLRWEDDVNFEERYIVLYTRKRKGGNLMPRKVPMTEKLYQVLRERYLRRDPSKPWVFWHTYWSSKTGEKMQGSYRDRKRLMKTLCRKAGVKYFRFHALRHAGASLMDRNGVPLGAIQEILGHQNRETTEIYLHSTDADKHDAMKCYERARQNSHMDSHTNK